MDSDEEMELPNRATTLVEARKPGGHVHHPPSRGRGLRGTHAARPAAYMRTRSVPTHAGSSEGRLLANSRSVWLGRRLSPNGPVRNGSPRIHGYITFCTNQ